MEIWVHGYAQGIAACNLMRRQKDWETACLCREDVGGGVLQQELSNSYKVHNLGNAKEWGNNQGAATGPLEERSGTLLYQDFSAMEERAQG